MVPLWVPLPRALLRDELPVVYIASASRSRGPSWNPPRTSTNHASMFGLYFLPVTAPLGAKRSEEHTSELQSHLNLVCRLLLEKKKKCIKIRHFLESRCLSSLISSLAHARS